MEMSRGLQLQMSLKIACRCGTSKAKSDPQYIHEVRDGKRKSKCPCLHVHKGCDETCSRVNCGNIHQAKPKRLWTINNSPHTTPIAYKRANSANDLSERSTTLLDGSWTTEETWLMMFVISLIGATTVSPTTEHTTVLYNYVMNSASCKKSEFSDKAKNLNTNARKIETPGGQTESCCQVSRLIIIS